MATFRQMKVALARLNPCPVLSFPHLTQGRGRCGLGYTDRTDAVLRENQGGEGMMSWVETGRVWPFGGVTAWALRVLVPSRSCLRYPHPPAIGSCPQPSPAALPWKLEGADGDVCFAAGSMGC